jgi:hypothetical protein
MDLKGKGGRVWTGFFPHRTGAVPSISGNERVIKCEEFAVNTVAALEGFCSFDLDPPIFVAKGALQH